MADQNYNDYLKQLQGNQNTNTTLPDSPKPYLSPQQPAPDQPDWLSKDLSKNNPLPWQKYLDPSIADTNDPNSLVSQTLGRGPNYYSGLIGQGVNQAGNSLGYQTRPLSGGMGASGNSMSKALASRAQRGVQTNLQGLQMQRDANAPMQYSKALGGAAGQLGAAQSLEHKNFQEQYQFQMQRYQLWQQWKAQQSSAEAQYMGQVIGTGAAVGAAVL